jgi:flagellar basal-body rod protein FlgG
MVALQRKQEALSNNLANVNTPGYKADQTSVRAFPELLLQKMGGTETPVRNGLPRTVSRPIGSINTGVYVQEVVPNFQQGNMRETGISTDVALVQADLPDETGGLFFNVQTETGEERLTRNGNFTVDGAGFLTTNEGYYVLDEAGNPIETNSLDFVVSEEGVITTEDGAFNLGVVYVEDVNELVKEGNNLYAGEAAAVPEGATYAVSQGFLEQANVDTGQTMTDMMRTYRLFEANQRALRAYDQSMDQAVNDVGRLS